MKSDLIYDVGLHRGEDTYFYMQKGYRVIAFEANPALVRYCSARFAEEIRSKQLVIVSGAIGPGSAPTIPFYVNQSTSVWGTASKEWAQRNERRGAPSKCIEVPRVDMVAEFRHHGIPIYLKLDAEGADLLALQALELATPIRPRYISLEADIDRLSAVKGQLDELWRLGYRWFQAIQQRYVAGSVLHTTALNGIPLTHQFEPQASGPFGTDLPGTWLTYDQCIVQFRRIFLRYRTVGHSSLVHKIGGPRAARLARRLTGLQSGWYDIHARS